MGCLMNLLWLLLGGIFTAVEYLISSILMMLTIVGIPFGMQTLKLAGLALWPFGKEVRSGGRSSGCLYILMNVLWIILYNRVGGKSISRPKILPSLLTWAAAGYIIPINLLRKLVI